MMLKSYCHSCGGQSMLCHTMSPHRLIPLPIKQSRILMNCVVAIVNLGKIYKCVAATFVAARTLPENSCFPTSSG
jgi:hypothetical protein